ncbi:unnamed protein product [Bemisia tabaci]|uniref:Uncharacterized protein n=1 Tax=Bemisia tabaci TaxID=7038 RepID=A0A9P0ANT8_BEMTA|nr:unnamed protein product [Bemisia tabaci]
MFRRHHPINAVCSTVCLLTTLQYFTESTKIVYSFPASGPSGSGAKSSSSSSQFVGAVKKREDLPGFDSEENFAPVKSYPGASSGDGGGGGGGPAYSVSSFSTGGDVAGFSTHIKHDVPRRGESPSASAPYHRSSNSEPEFYFPSPAERAEPSRLFKSLFAQEEDEPSASPLVSEASTDERRLEEIKKHMEEAERSFDDDGPSAGGAEGGSFNDEGFRSLNEEEEEDGVGCKNCNYAQFQMEH